MIQENNECVLPNLAGVATSDLAQTIGGGNFSAAYINWSRTMHLLREHASGWLPEIVRTAEGKVVHAAPHGAFMMIRFRDLNGRTTPEVPQAIMDNRNNAIPVEKITARDITDTHRRGVCMAAAFTFGLAYELWAKMPLGSGFAEGDPPPAQRAVPANGQKPNGEHAESANSRTSAIHAISLWTGEEKPSRETITAVCHMAKVKGFPSMTKSTRTKKNPMTEAEWSAVWSWVQSQVQREVKWEELAHAGSSAGES